MDHDMSIQGPSHLITATESSVLTWDILKGQRVSTYSSNSLFYTCAYLAPNLICAAGSDRCINLYDTRSKSGSKPIWSTQVLSDNLYTIAKSGESGNTSSISKIYLAGASGLIHGIDLRAGHQELWDLAKSDRAVALSKTEADGAARVNQNIATNGDNKKKAILSLSCKSELLVAMRENGEVLGVSTKGPLSQNLQPDKISASSTKDLSYYCEDKGPFLFSQSVMSSARSRIKCDTRMTDDTCIDIVTGSEDGVISVLMFDEYKAKIYPFRQLKVSSDPVIAVKWAKNGVYFGARDKVGLIKIPA